MRSDTQTISIGSPANNAFEMEQLHDAAALFRSHPHFATPDRVAHAVTRVVTPGPTVLDNR
jgi:hypothetical protein